MRAVVQRVSRAEVRVGGLSVARIGTGITVLLGVLRGDDHDCAMRLAERIARFRIFPDAEGRMNRSLLEVRGQALVVSQITLAAEGRKGLRPSLDAAAAPALAEGLYRAFVEALSLLGAACEEGVFGERMELELVNDGPVTFVLEERPRSAATAGPPASPQVLA